MKANMLNKLNVVFASARYSSTTNTHPNFNVYFAMLLHADSLTDVKENIPTEKYNELIEKYGLKEGIKSGYSYYIGSSNNSNK